MTDNAGNQATSNRAAVVVLGAGLAGLSAAWLLARKGYQVVVLERETYCGGLAITKQRNGFRYDLGPHNIHTGHAHVLQFLKREFTSLFAHRPSFKIFRRSRFIDYPIQGPRVITSLKPMTIVPAAVSFLLARCALFLKEPRHEASFRDWIVNRFGRILHREYFHDYPSKVWGLETDRIHKYVAEKRVPTMSVLELIQGVFGRIKGAGHPEFTDENFYLRLGIGELPEFFEAGLRASGGEIINSVTLEKIERAGDDITGVRYRASDGKPQHLPCSHLLSTIPVNDLVTLVPDLPGETVQAARDLTYRSTVLLFVQLRAELPLPGTILYFTEPEILFSRLYDVGQFSKRMIPEGKGLLCIEFPCQQDDEVWSMSVADLYAHALAILEARGLLTANHVETSFTEKVSHSYPVFDTEYAVRLESCFRDLRRFRNLLSYGRQGGFMYINTDGAIQQGFKAATAVVMARDYGSSCAEWFAAKG
ncbi:MAG: FAD-dependent oxidoreductase [Vicinamibacterales bacterium]